MKKQPDYEEVDPVINPDFEPVQFDPILDAGFRPDPANPGYFIHIQTGQRIHADQLKDYISNQPISHQPTASPDQAPPVSTANVQANLQGADVDLNNPNQPQMSTNPQTEEEKKGIEMPYVPFTIKKPELNKDKAGPTPIGLTQEKRPMPTRFKVIIGGVAFLFLVTVGLVFTALGSERIRRADTSELQIAIAQQLEMIRIIEDYEKNTKQASLLNNMAISQSVLTSQSTVLTGQAEEIDQTEFKLVQEAIVDADVDAALQEANRNNRFEDAFVEEFDKLIEINRRQVVKLANSSTDPDQLATLTKLESDLRGLLSPAAFQALEAQTS